MAHWQSTSIQGIQPIQDNFQCQALTTRKAGPRNRVNKPDRSKANNFLRAARQIKSDHARRQALAEVIPLPCCIRNHRYSAQVQGESRQKVSDWSRQFDGGHMVKSLLTASPELPTRSVVHETCHFSSERKRTSKSTRAVLLSDLTANKNSGSIYMYAATLAPGMIKIGFTTRKVGTCFAEIRRKCGYTPKLIAEFANVPFVHRVERLIFSELAPYRQDITQCSCGVHHIEWFKVDINHAKGIMETWCSLMQDMRLYGPDGSPSLALNHMVVLLEKQNMTVNGKKLRKIWAKYSWC